MRMVYELSDRRVVLIIQREMVAGNLHGNLNSSKSPIYGNYFYLRNGNCSSRSQRVSIFCCTLRNQSATVLGASWETSLVILNVWLKGRKVSHLFVIWQILALPLL